MSTCYNRNLEELNAPSPRFPHPHLPRDVLFTAADYQPFVTPVVSPHPAIVWKYSHLPEGQRIVSSPKTREAHLAQKTLKMRLPFSNHPHNSQKKRALQRHL